MVNAFGKFVEAIKHCPLADIGGFKGNVGNEIPPKNVEKDFLPSSVADRLVTYGEANLCREHSIPLYRTSTRVIQDDHCVNALWKRGTNLLQVKVHLIGVRLVAHIVDEAIGV